MQMKGMTFPVVCKPIVAHGSKDAHTMALVFNASGFKDSRTPCLIQQYICHDAVLFKIFVIGSRCVIRAPVPPVGKTGYFSSSLSS